MNKNSKIYLAGHTGLVGSSLYEKLNDQGYENIITRTHKELDLTNQEETKNFFKKEKPEYVFLIAAKVGGIKVTSKHPADFSYTNLMIESNVIKASYDTKVKKLIFLGSACVYPKECPQPIKEKYLLTSSLDSSMESYAIAKIAGLKLCEYFNEQYETNFIPIVINNIYGPNDKFNINTSSVLPALITKFHLAKKKNEHEVEIWGSGRQRREFLYVDDLSEALLFIMNNYSEKEMINVGTGEDISIRELAKIIKEIVGYEGRIKYDETKPEGTLRRLLDISKIRGLGWKHKIELKEGIKKTYAWFLENYDE